MASAFWLPVIFIGSSYMLYYISSNHPPLGVESGTNHTNRKQVGSIIFPSNFNDLVQLAHALQRYKVENITYLLLLFMAAYIYKQTFAIPGSVFMNLLGGALFGMMAFPLVCLLTAFGATSCYFLSHTFGKKQVVRFFPERVKYFENKLKENRDSLFFFLLFLRMFPMSPNWLMNIVAPIVGVPLHYFVLSVLIGLAPYNFICVQTGSILSSLNSLDDVFTPWTLMALLGIAVAASLPGIIIKVKQRRTAKSKRHTD